MKFTIHVLCALLFCTYTSYDKTDPVKSTKVDALNKSGYAFNVKVSQINSNYSEIASAMFRNKLVIVSSKKIGGLGSGVDPKTKEPYTDLFCLDVEENGSFSQPFLFSRILNTKGNEGKVAFSPDEHTVYYTRSERDNVLNYKLYKAELKKNSQGKWINETELAISSDDYSVENPHVSADGKFLFFSSNMKDGFGGFDIYMARINKDGSIGSHVNLGGKINTESDEKYPYTTDDNKELYFSSEGHNSIGGYDIFISNRKQIAYSKPRNLGRAINSNKDDIAFMIINGDTGVFSSNKGKSTNAYNMYHFKSEMIYKDLQGVVTTQDNKILPNATIVLLNDEGEEVERQTTSVDASYSFKLKPYDDYEIVIKKEGFEAYTKKLAPNTFPEKSVVKMEPKVEVSYNTVKH
ncbi:carboxypeptidase-like regulatory domain-containing protein [uncultured Winogradskyella sp.]|uniref:carboxypeptidase-like regulatory domain-containing protein n=1 Tax=Winogradskyella sp. 4-2091 TaxID=3381659 RepID=UPI00262E44AB|nr:carboxypeptidase-like regulatory domain-containing protein [uncultured Winogradskyella sp.]